MRQSNKDSKGGKTASSSKTHASGQASDAAAKKAAAHSEKSPAEPQKHGGKKTTP